MRMTYRTMLLFLLILTAVSLAGCGEKEAAEEHSQAHPTATLTMENTAESMAESAARLPDYVLAAAPSTQAAYQYAVDHPEELVKYPCYCGCSAFGHTDNWNCYIQKVMPDGEPIFDIHALSCQVCVNITSDIIKMKAEGRSSLEVRRYIDTTYSIYGPSTNTPLPAN